MESDSSVQFAQTKRRGRSPERFDTPVYPNIDGNDTRGRSRERSVTRAYPIMERNGFLDVEGFTIGFGDEVHATKRSASCPARITHIEPISEVSNQRNWTGPSCMLTTSPWAVWRWILLMTFGLTVGENHS